MVEELARPKLGALGQSNFGYSNIKREDSSKLRTPRTPHFGGVLAQSNFGLSAKLRSAVTALNFEGCEIITETKIGFNQCA